MVVFHLDAITGTKDKKRKADTDESQPAPCIVHFDALGNHRTFSLEIAENITEYLRCEWAAKKKPSSTKKAKASKKEPRQTTVLGEFPTSLPLLIPSNIPKQLSGIDCGLFVLGFTEAILLRSPVIMRAASRGMKFLASIVL
jgi:Ulp1 family protease